MTQAIKGILVALWTPTDAEHRLDTQGLARNLDFLQGKGLDGALVLGSTGEFLFLEPGERVEALREIARAGSGLSLYVNPSDVSPKVVARLCAAAEEVGAAGVSLLPPHFFPLPQCDVLEFFLATARRTRLPVMLYNFPERTGHTIELDTIRAVADAANLSAVKQSGADFDYHRPLAALGREKGYALLTGGDTRFADAAVLGAVGCVSGLANAIPELMVALAAAVASGDRTRASELQSRVAALGAAIDGLPFPYNVMAAMDARGLAVGVPKAIHAQATIDRYRDTVTQVRELYSQWGLAAA